MKYDGDEVEVRIGISAVAAAAALALTNLESISWNEDPKEVAVAVGIGSAATEVYDKLVEYAGSITRWHDEIAGVSGGTGTLASNVGAFTSPKVPLWIQIKNLTTGRKVILNNCIGKYTNDLKSPDAFLMEAWDFKFNSATETPGP